MSQEEKTSENDEIPSLHLYSDTDIKSINWPKNPTTLELICDNIVVLPDLSKMCDLIQLNVVMRYRSMHIPSAHLPLQLEKLELHYRDMVGMTAIPYLKDLSYLVGLELSGIRCTEIDPAYLPLSLKCLTLHSCVPPFKLPDLRHLYNLTRLILIGNPGIVISPQSLLPRLKKLDLDWCDLTELPDLRHLTDLVELKLKFNNITRINPAHLPLQLEKLILYDFELHEMPNLYYLTDLVELDLSWCGADIESKHLPAQLKILKLDNYGLNKLPDLRRLRDLVELDLGYNHGIKINPAHWPPRLRLLTLCNNVDDDILPNLSTLINLRVLNIGVNDTITLDTEKDLRLNDAACINPKIIIPSANLPPHIVELIVHDRQIDELILDSPNLDRLDVSNSAINNLVVTSPNIRSIIVSGQGDTHMIKNLDIPPDVQLIVNKGMRECIKL